LLITGSRAAYNAINSIVRKLDVRRSQVFVEADILDINVDNRFKFGTNIFGGRKGGGGSNIIQTWEAGGDGFSDRGAGGRFHRVVAGSR
jgi:type II secretory pathway component GspD/PulD (secretin)